MDQSVKRDHTSSRNAIETGPRTFDWFEKVALRSFALPNHLQKLQAMRLAATILCETATDLALLQHLAAIANQTLLEMW
ncbi:MAG: hypothetical protein ACRC1G_09470 [Bradyrhizobium sp.]|nr:hypothetical protein [Bradyrhizobium sp.]